MRRRSQKLEKTTLASALADEPPTRCVGPGGHGLAPPTWERNLSVLSERALSEKAFLQFGLPDRRIVASKAYELGRHYRRSKQPGRSRHETTLSSEPSPPPVSSPSRWPDQRRADTTLLNVSYDPTRELYKAYDEAFAAYWKEKTGETVTIEQSHGGSGAQARAVIDGLAADVVTLALEGDINKIADAGLLAKDWRGKLPEQLDALHLDHRLPRPQGQSEGHPGLGRPREGRRRGHHAESEDLRRRALELSRRLGLRQRRSSAATRRRSRNSSARSTSNVPVLDAGARGSTTTFVERGIGDVLLAWENEAFLAINELGPDEFEIVVPPTSIKAEPPVARRRRQRRQEGHARGGAGLSRIPLQRRGAEHHRQELLSPVQARGGRSRRSWSASPR